MADAQLAEAALSAEDERAIGAVLVRYATAADTRDRAMLESCFAPDARAEYGEQIGTFETRAALVDGLLAMLVNCGETLHFISNVVAHRVEGGAEAKCYTHAIVHLPGMEQPVRTAGTYTDRLIRTSGEWRIMQRIYHSVA